MKVRNYDLFGPKLRVEKFNVIKKPILQVSYDGVTWHDVPNAPPIPYKEWSDENT